MGTPVQPTPGPNVELELAKLANDAIAAGHNPGDVTAKLHATIQYLRQFPQVAQQATNALADGKTTPADITRLLAPHVRAMQGAATPDDTPDDPSYAQRALGGIAALGHDIPGVEAAQAGARALVRGQSYRDALSDIQQAEQSAPKAVRVGNNLIGGGIAAMATPGGPVLQSARYGILHGLLNSNPDENLAQRTNAAALEGGVGAVAGKVGDQLTTVARALASKTPGAQLLARKAAMAAADATNYGNAEAEAATQGGTTPIVRQALNHPLVKPLADDIRQSFALQGRPTDDASVLLQTYRELSQNERALVDRQANAATSRPLTKREQSDVASVKQLLLDAATSASQKPPITFDVPAATHTVEPQITPERPTLYGPASAPADATETPAQRLAREALQRQHGRAAARAAGPIESQAVEDALSRPEVRPEPDRPTPGFVLRPQPDQVRPGVEISTPAMRVQTAPPEDVPALMPSLRQAVREHATAMGQIRGLQTGVDAATREGRGLLASANKLGSKSPEALRAALQKMTPEEAQAALAGALGRTRELMRATPNPLTGFGLGQSLMRAGRVGPFLQAAEQQAGGAPIPAILARALVASQSGPIAGGNP